MLLQKMDDIVWEAWTFYQDWLRYKKKYIEMTKEEETKTFEKFKLEWTARKI